MGEKEVKMININNKNYDTHVINTNNPHNVTKTQVGLGNVDNTSDINKPVSTATQTALMEKSERTGLAWTTTSTTATEWYDIAFGNGVFVAVAPTGANRVTTSSDGITWTPRAVSGFDFRALAFGNGIFVAVSNVGTNRVMTSLNGVTWTSRTVELSAWWSITFGNGIFVAVAMAGTNKIMTSSDGITWTPVAAPATVGELRHVTYGGGIFVAVARSGTDRVITSPDGITWTPRAVELSSWNKIAFGNGLFVAVANDGVNRVMTSPDGITWTPRTVTNVSWLGVAFGNGLFVAVAENGLNRLMYSLDGSIWYYKSIQESNWRNVIYVEDMFVAIASAGISRIMVSGKRNYSTMSKVTKKSVIGEVSVTILPADWTGTGPFEDTISVVIAGEQITSTTHDIKVSLVLSSDINIARQEQEAYSYFSKGEISATNVLKITCFDYKPSVTLNIMLEVIKKW
jgi:hypothetical protein